MVGSDEFNFPSDEKKFCGFQKNPTVSLNRINVIPFLKNIIVKYNKNGRMVPYSVDEAQSSILRNMLATSVHLEKIGDREHFECVSKKAKTPKPSSNLSFTVTKNKTKRSRKPKASQTRESYSIRTNNKKTKQLKSKKCSKTFENRKSVLKHVKSKHSNSVHLCAYCMKKYVRRSYFIKHIELHCDACFVLQRNKSELRKHILKCRQSKNIKDADRNKYICNICNSNFDSYCTMAYHIAAVHSNNSPLSLKELYFVRSIGSTEIYVCQYCKESTIDKDYIESHVSALRNVIVITINTTVKYPCDQCLQSFDKEDDLLQHKLSHTNNVSDNSEPRHNETEGSVTETIDQSIMSVPQAKAICNTSSCVTNNVLEKPLSDTDPQPQNNTNTPLTNSEILQIVKHETTQKQSTAQNKDLNKSIEKANFIGLDTGLTTKKTVIQSRIGHSRILKYYCKMCEKYFSTNFAILRHMKVRHILCKLTSTAPSSLQSLSCLENEPVGAKPESECDDYTINDDYFNNADDNCMMDVDDNPGPTTSIVPTEYNLAVINNKTLEEKILAGLSVSEVPIEF